MKYFLSLVIFAGMSSAHSQSGLFSSTNNTADAITLEAYDLSGNPIPTGSKFAVEGSPMLNDHFEKGIVRLQNGKQYKDVPLNLSLVSNDLYFKKDSLVLQFINPVEQFVLPVSDNVKEKNLFFKSGYPAIDNQSNKSFYQLLTNGPKLELLKYKYKTARELYVYGGPVKNEYVSADRLYVYEIATGKIVEINANVKSLKKALPAYEADIDKFVLQNKIKFKHEEEIKSLIDFINKQL